MSKCRLFFSLIVFAWSVTGAYGLQVEPPADENEKPETDSVRHDEVTVTATRSETPVALVGQSVTIVTSEQMEAQGARTVSQVLESVPGLSVVRSGSFGGATTVFVRGGESDFNLVLIDGVPVNQAGGSFDFGDLGTANIERIEIVRGPSSVLYGANAASATINILTRQGEGRPTGLFGFEAGNYGSRLLRGQIQGGSDRIHYSLGGHLAQTDGFYAFNNQYNRGELSARGVFDLTGLSSLSAHVRYLNSEYEFPTDFDGSVIDPNDYRTTEETHYSIAYQNQISARYSTRLQYGYHRRDSSNFTVEDGVVDFFNDTFRSNESRNFLDWQNNFEIGAGNLVTTGLSYNREQSISEGLQRRSVGIYLQDQYQFRNRFFLTAGLRYDDNNRFRSFLTGNVGMGYRPNEQWKIRATLGNGFRAPAFAEIIGFPVFGIVGNPDLQPEKNLAADFGVDYLRSDGRSGFSGTIFFNRFSDLIEFTFLVPPGSPNYINVEAARSKGFELEAFVVPVTRFRVGGQYTLTDTEVTDPGTVAGGGFDRGQALLRRPRHSGNIFGEFLRERYRLRIDFKYKGRRDDIQFFPDFSSNRVTLDSYWKTDFGVTFPLVGFSDSRGDLALVLRGENIFNQRYTEVAGFQSPGRSLFAGLEVGF